jgi:hypothetical protein
MMRPRYTSPPQNQTPLDDLSPAAITFLFNARRNGMTWIHPALLCTAGPVQELADNGFLTVRPQLVHPVIWRWEAAK